MVGFRERACISPWTNSVSILRDGVGEALMNRIISLLIASVWLANKINHTCYIQTYHRLASCSRPSLVYTSLAEMETFSLSSPYRGLSLSTDDQTSASLIKTEAGRVPAGSAFRGKRRKKRWPWNCSPDMDIYGARRRVALCHFLHLLCSPLLSPKFLASQSVPGYEV